MTAAGFHLMELGGVDADDTGHLVKWVQSVRQVKAFDSKVTVERTVCLNGEYVTHSIEEHVSRTAVFLDDFESFTPDARKALVAKLKRSQRPGLAPTIITCTQIRHPEMQCLSEFHQIRLYAPVIKVVRSFLSTTIEFRYLNGAMSSLPGCRDIRRIKRTAEWLAIDSGKPKDKSQTTNVLRKEKCLSNNFEASRQLFLKQCTVDDWMKVTEARDIDLLRHHMVDYVDNDISLLSSVYDHLSHVDIMQPDRFELHGAILPFQRYVAAFSVQINSRARDVGALPPPRRLETSTGGRPPKPVGSELPGRQEDWRDAPQSLRDRWSGTAPY